MSQVKAKLDDVIEAIEFSNEEMVAYLDTQTGRVEVVDEQTRGELRRQTPVDKLPDWQRPLVEVARLIEAEEEAMLETPDDASRRFLPLPDQFDVHEWQVMMEFAAGLEDPSHSRALCDALRGSGAFRRFKDTAHRLGVIDAWYAARDAAYRREAIDWCEVNGVAWEEDEADQAG